MGEPAEGRTKSRCILDAARKCFARHGFHGASMARIAEEAGVSVGHIYRYFENKEAVVAAIVEEDLGVVAERIARIEGSPDQIATVLLETLQETTDFAETAMRLEILSEAARNPKIAAMMREADARVHAYLKTALMRSCRANGACNGATVADENASIDAKVEVLSALYDGLKTGIFRRQERFTPTILSEAREVIVSLLSRPVRGEGASDAESAKDQLYA